MADVGRRKGPPLQTIQMIDVGRREGLQAYVVSGFSRTETSGDRGSRRWREGRQVDVGSSKHALGRGRCDEIQRWHRDAAGEDSDLGGQERKRVCRTTARKPGRVRRRVVVVLMMMVIVSRRDRCCARALRLVHQAVWRGDATVRVRPVDTHADRTERGDAHLDDQEGDRNSERVAALPRHETGVP